MKPVRKAVITAAGRGTRQFPATKTLQKELIPLVDADGYTKPALQIIMEEALASGIEEICIVANPGNVGALQSHFAGLTEAQQEYLQDKDWAMQLAAQLQRLGEATSFVVQQEQEGYGHAVYQAKEWVGDEPFILLLADHIYMSPDAPCVKQVLDAYAQWQCPISSVLVTPEDKIYRYGTVGGTLLGDGAYRITKMQEKPTLEEARRHLRAAGMAEDEYLCFFGMHVFPPEIFDCLQHLIENNLRFKNEIQLTSAQELLLERSKLYAAVTVTGKRYDLGVPDGLIQSQVALALASPYADEIRAMLSAA